MIDGGDTSNPDWSYRELERIDVVCDEFERAWNERLTPRIEDILDKNSDLPRSLLLFELVRLERNLCNNGEESPEKKEYLNRFPRDQAAIERVWRQSTVVRSVELPPTMIQSSPTLPSEAQPEQMGRYRILSKLGEGGFGAVYLAHDPVRGHDVALKVPHRPLLQNPQRRAEIMKEAAIGEMLDHPNLVRTLGTEELGDQLLIVLQFVDGRNLAEWYNQDRPTPQQVAELVLVVAQTLAYLHEQGYVHRDLKPANILIDINQHVYVVDFGMTLHEDEQRKHKGELAGTRAYMSPEQVRRQAHLVDGQSDLWSVGVILYRLLTDRLPFGGAPPRQNSHDYSEYIRDLENEISDHDPRPLRMIRPALSRKLEEICLRCLEKRKRDRYPTGHDLAEDLRLYLEKAAEGPRSTIPQRTIRIVPKGGLRSFDASDAEFFLELLPGPRTSGGLPASLNFWRNRLSGTSGALPVDVGVIYGPSGCGKSSLVRAGLLPILGDKFVPLIIEATSEDTEVRLLKALRQAVPGLPVGDSLVDICRRVGDRGAGGGRRVLLVFDQFEQWLHAHPDLTQSQLLAGLRNCNGTRLQALFLVRDDFWSPLTRFMEQLEIPLQENNNAAAIDLFDPDHARRILTAFGRAYDRLPGDSELTAAQQRFLTSAIDGLAEGGRIICVRLALFAEMMKDRPWTPEELAAVGGAKGIGVAFLEQKFGRNAPTAYRAHCRYVPKVLDCLLPPYGSELKGQMRTIADLREAAGYSDPRAFEDLIRILDSDLKLLTPIVRDNPDGRPQPAIQSSGDELPCYQLTHDYLVPSVREWLTTDLGRTRPGRALLRLRERSDDWNRQPESRRLPSLPEWMSIWRCVPRRAWSSAQQRMMKAANRRIFTRTGIVAIIVFLSLAAGREINGRFHAEALREQLMSATTPRISDVIRDMQEYWRWVAPVLTKEQSVPSSGEMSDEDSFQRQLHIALALGQHDPSQFEMVISELEHVAPEHLNSVVALLKSHASWAAERSWQRFETALEVGRGDVVLAHGALLALVDHDGTRWSLHADAVARLLAGVRPTQVGVWGSLYEPVGKILAPSALKLFRDGDDLSVVERTNLAGILVSFASGDAAELVSILEDADPSQVRMILDPLQKIPDVARAEVRTRFHAAATAPVFNGEPTDALVPGILAQELSVVGGLIALNWAFASAVPLDEFDSLCEKLYGDRYRPSSVRPYATLDRAVVAAVWLRDGRRWCNKNGLTAEEFLKLDELKKSEGLRVADFAWFSQSADGPPQLSALWVEDTTEVRTYLDRSLEEHNKLFKELTDQGFWLDRWQMRSNDTGQAVYAALYRKPSVGEPDTESLSQLRYGNSFGDFYPGHLQSECRFTLLDPSRPDHVGVHELIADVSQKLELELDAKKRLDKLFTLIRYLIIVGEPAEARDHLSSLLKDNPSYHASAQICERQATVYAALGETDLLKSETARYESLDKHNPALLLLLRIREASAADVADEAIRLRDEFDRAVADKTFPESPETLERCARAHAVVATKFASNEEAMGRKAKQLAIARLRESLTHPPGTTPAHILIADAEFDGLRNESEFRQMLLELGLDRRFTAAWHGDPGYESRQLLNLTPGAQLQQALQMQRAGFEPVCLSAQFDGAGDQPVIAAVWRRPVVPQSVRTRNARRMANLAVALARLGETDLVAELMRETHGREAAALAVELVAAQLEPFVIVQALRDARSTVEQRGFLLGLGGYSPSQIAVADHPWLVEKFSSLAVASTDPELLAAAQWCATRLGFAVTANDTGRTPGSKWYRSENGHTMVIIRPPDEFLMGSPSSEPDRNDQETQHWVRLNRPFRIAATETTVAQFDEFLADPKVKKFYGDNPPRFTKKYAPSNFCPQISVTWLDAARYCQWLSEKEKLPESQWCYPNIWLQRDGSLSLPSDFLKRTGYRLPTEAEFELATRVGDVGMRPFGNSESLLPAYAWYANDSSGQTHPVATLKPNGFGLFDMLGNANEWCHDEYDGYLVPIASHIFDESTSERITNPVKATEPRISRGGSFEHAAKDVRSAQRFSSNIDNRHFIGFRIARTEAGD